MKKRPCSKVKKILLIKLDAIGDYILFRNFISEIKKSEKFTGYNITLAGNKIWKSMSECLDNGYIDKFIWIDRHKFCRNLFYRWKTYEKINEEYFIYAIHPNYSREFISGDSLILFSNARYKIGSDGDDNNIHFLQKALSNKFYSKLVPCRKGVVFEFNRNKEFFENIIGDRICLRRPYIKKRPNNETFRLPSEYIIIFVGAGKQFRKWPLGKLYDVVNYLLTKTNYQLVVCGGSSDIDDALILIKKFGDQALLNLTGKTSLMELVSIISGAKLLVSNETSAPHIAIAVDTPTVVISNGNHYGRFTPYPASITKKYYCAYPQQIEANLDDVDLLCQKYGKGSRLPIQNVSSKSVIKLIEKAISQIHVEEPA